MRFLLSNDDGYFATGLHVLAEALSTLGEVIVVAPEQDRSGASNSLTLDRPLQLKKADNGFYYVNGTPTDCVHLAITGMLDFKPDMIISGINHGANMGDDTIYSGTVAAATEGYLLGIPALAVSLARKHDNTNQHKQTPHIAHFDTAAQVVYDLVQRFQRQPFIEPTLLNINVPNLPFAELKGQVVTRLGRRHKAEPVIRSQNPRGQTIYWVGPAGSAQDAGDGTDFFAINQQQVSITPLQIDLTHYPQLDSTQKWLNAS